MILTEGKNFKTFLKENDAVTLVQLTADFI